MNRNTVRQLAPAVGEHVLIAMEAMAVQCEVIDAKNAYGNVRLLVRPLFGVGQQWVDVSRLRAAAEPGKAVTA